MSYRKKKQQNLLGTSSANDTTAQTEFIDNIDIDNHKGKYYFDEVGAIVQKIMKQTRRGNKGPPKDYTRGALSLAAKNWVGDDYSDDESIKSSALNSKDSGNMICRVPSNLNEVALHDQNKYS